LGPVSPTRRSPSLPTSFGPLPPLKNAVVTATPATTAWMPARLVPATALPERVLLPSSGRLDADPRVRPAEGAPHGPRPGRWRVGSTSADVARPVVRLAWSGTRTLPSGAAMPAA